MKTSAVIRIILYSLVALTLVGVLCWGLGAFGGMGISDFLDSINLSVGAGVRYTNESSYSIGASSCPAEGITDINIYWTAGELTVQPYDGNEIIFTEESKNAIPDELILRWKSEGSDLTIHYCKSGYSKWPANAGKTLTLLVPRTLAENGLKELNISTISAEQNVSGVNAQSFDSETVSGDVSISAMTAAEADFEAVSGKLSAEGVTFGIADSQSVSGSVLFAGEIGRIECETVSGVVRVDSRCVPQADISTVSGEVIFKLPADKGFTVNYSTVSGGINCSMPSVTSKNSLKVGDGATLMDIDTISGNITIADYTE